MKAMGKGFSLASRCGMSTLFLISYTRGFPEMVLPQNGWFIVENPMKMDDDWGTLAIRIFPHLFSTV